LPEYIEEPDIEESLEEEIEEIEEIGPDLDAISQLEEPQLEEPHFAAPPKAEQHVAEPASVAREKRTENEPLLGASAARLFEYLKSLLNTLPKDKREEFAASGLKDRLDGIIGKLKPMLAAASPGHDESEGLLAAGNKLRSEEPGAATGGAGKTRKVDPRRSADGRRSRGDRRSMDDRRMRSTRREESDRRAGERRTPPPVVELPSNIPPTAAEVVLGADGKPIEIAGLPISRRMAKLIEIIRKEKKHGGS
jgi:hypothetical protein